MLLCTCISLFYIYRRFPKNFGRNKLIPFVSGRMIRKKVQPFISSCRIFRKSNYSWYNLHVHSYLIYDQFKLYCYSVDFYIQGPTGTPNSETGITGDSPTKQTECAKKCAVYWNCPHYPLGWSLLLIDHFLHLNIINVNQQQILTKVGTINKVILDSHKEFAHDS